MFQKSKAGVMVKTEHDKTHGTDRQKKKTNKDYIRDHDEKEKKQKKQIRQESINQSGKSQRERGVDVGYGIWM